MDRSRSPRNLSDEARFLQRLAEPELPPGASDAERAAARAEAAAAVEAATSELGGHWAKAYRELRPDRQPAARSTAALFRAAFPSCWADGAWQRYSRPLRVNGVELPNAEGPAEYGMWQLGHELYEEGGILVFETWTAENARVVPNTVHKWKVKGEELEFESGVINFFVIGFRPCEEEHARDILKELI